jgi:GH25 family lysozyme M1 (1,4-beta-N-acetylmuramidase)
MPNSCAIGCLGSFFPAMPTVAILAQHFHFTLPFNLPPAALQSTIIASVTPRSPFMTTVPGIDVSRYQGTVNWKAVADAGFRFAVVRATLWNVKIDETFETNWNGARSAGLLVSAYHVVKADVAAAAQIDFFCAGVDRPQVGSAACARHRT